MEESLTRQKISALESLEAYIKDDINARSAVDNFTVNVIIRSRSCDLIDGEALESTASVEINRINNTVARLRQSISTLDLISEPALVANASPYEKPLFASPFTNSELSLESITSDLGGSISAKSPSHLKYQFLVDSRAPPTLSPLSARSATRASSEGESSQQEEAIILIYKQNLIVFRKPDEGS